MVLLLFMIMSLGITMKTQCNTYCCHFQNESKTLILEKNIVYDCVILFYIIFILFENSFKTEVFSYLKLFEGTIQGDIREISVKFPLLSTLSFYQVWSLDKHLLILQFKK